MTAKLINLKKHRSDYGGDFYFLFFKGEDGQSYRTCIYPKFGNFRRWESIIRQFLMNRSEIWLANLRLKGQRLIDADSLFEVVKPATAGS